MHIDWNSVVPTVVAVVGLVCPYVLKTHSKTKAILQAIEEIAHAANGPEQE